MAESPLESSSARWTLASWPRVVTLTTWTSSSRASASVTVAALSKAYCAHRPACTPGLVEVARAEVGRRQIQHVGAEAALVQSVGGADAVDRGDQARVFGRPARRILGHGDLL